MLRSLGGRLGPSRCRGPSPSHPCSGGAAHSRGGGPFSTGAAAPQPPPSPAPNPDPPPPSTTTLRCVHWPPQAPVAALGMWTVPPSLRPLGASLMTVAIHALGDVPSPPLLGALQVGQMVERLWAAQGFKFLNSGCGKGRLC